MLENYIERNIFRKVYLCEQLFEFQEIDIEQTAISLRVTTPTILHDLESLAECLEYCIKEQVRGNISINSYSNMVLLFLSSHSFCTVNLIF